MRIAHLSDTHIRNLKYHSEYKNIFDEIYKILNDEEIDLIVHCGDICHTKTQISPEFVEMCSDFLNNLSDIAPTYIILGNHDGSCRNPDRQDSISPIVKSLNKSNLFLMKNSGEKIINKDFSLNVLSVFDPVWTSPSDFDKVNIALYHGSVTGCETELGWKMDHCENDISIFKDFDFAMLGDIHKPNQILDKEGRIRYAGSTIQQNFSEANDKGFLIWDIRSKDEFDVKRIIIKNPKPFISIELTKGGKLPRNLKVQSGARVRLITNNNLSLSNIQKVFEIARRNFSPESITFLNRSLSRDSVENIVNNFKKENLRDLKIQEKLILEYLKDFRLSDSLKSKILDINKKYDAEINSEEDPGRNIKFEILTFKWENLFNYGSKNKIDFKKLGGIVGIFGKNYSGKSSIIDGLIYTMFNSISKNSRKNLNIVNDKKDSCWGEVTLRHDKKIYRIKRTTEKYVKKLKGSESTEARTDVNFEYTDEITGNVVSLNGLTRADTDKNITKLFGTLEDFLLTSMASQLGSLDFINEGSTKRKEILAKFLDLDNFDKKFKLVKDDVSDLKSSFKKIEERDYELEVSKARKELSNNEKKIESIKKESEKINDRAKKINEELIEVTNHINSIPSSVEDYAQIEHKISKEKGELSDRRKALSFTAAELSSKKEIFAKIQEFIDNFDISSLQKTKIDLEAKTLGVAGLADSIKEKERQLHYEYQKIKPLDEVPCGPEFSHCKFIRGAYQAKEKINIVELALKKQKNNYEQLKSKMNENQLEEVKRQIDKYSTIIKQHKELMDEITHKNITLNNNKESIELIENKILILNKNLEEAIKNKKLIDELSDLQSKKTNLKKRYSEAEISLKEKEKELHELLKEHGSLQQRCFDLEKQKEESIKTRDDYEAYELFLKCMHPSGIAYDIIKKSLPVINEEIAEILLNIVDFQVFFVNDESRLDLYLKRPDDPNFRALEMGSGAEKAIASIAIRLALLHVSTLPCGDLFILDEPGTSLDDENRAGFIKILDLIKEFFRCTILISHLDALKDAADVIIDIENKKGFAHVNQ